MRDGLRTVLRKDLELKLEMLFFQNSNSLRAHGSNSTQESNPCLRSRALCRLLVISLHTLPKISILEIILPHASHVAFITMEFNFGLFLDFLFFVFFVSFFAGCDGGFL